MANHNPIINEITKAQQNHGERALVYLSKVPGLTSFNFNSFTLLIIKVVFYINYFYKL